MSDQIVVMKLDTIYEETREYQERFSRDTNLLRWQFLAIGFSGLVLHSFLLPQSQSLIHPCESINPIVGDGWRPRVPQGFAQRL